MPLFDVPSLFSRRNMPLRKSRKKIDDPESLKLLLDPMNCGQSAYQCIVNCAADFVNWMDDTNNPFQRVGDIPVLCEYVLRINSHRSSPAGMALTHEVDATVEPFSQNICNLNCIVYALKSPSVPLLLIYDSEIVPEGLPLCAFSRHTPEGQTVCLFTKCKGRIMGTFKRYPPRANEPLTHFAPGASILGSVHRIMGRTDMPKLTFEDFPNLVLDMNFMNDPNFVV